MKIKALASLCKESQHIQAYDRMNGSKAEQWIGDGMGSYPIHGLPYLDENSIFTLFEVPKDKREEYEFDHAEMPPALCADDATRDEVELERPAIHIRVNGRLYLPFDTSRGIVLVDGAYLKPIADVMKLVLFFERRTPEGGVYIACKVGFLLCALILPAMVDKDLTFSIKHLADRCRYAYDLTERRFAPAELPPRIDAETGEIMDMDDADVENGMVVDI